MKKAEKTGLRGRPVSNNELTRKNSKMFENSV